MHTKKKTLTAKHKDILLHKTSTYIDYTSYMRTFWNTTGPFDTHHVCLFQKQVHLLHIICAYIFDIQQVHLTHEMCVFSKMKRKRHFLHKTSTFTTTPYMLTFLTYNRYMWHTTCTSFPKCFLAWIYCIHISRFYQYIESNFHHFFLATLSYMRH